MTFRALLLFVCACAPSQRETNVDLAKSRALLDQEAARAQGPVVLPADAVGQLLPHAEKIVACAPTRSDVAVMVHDGQVVAFDRGLLRDGAMEACFGAALPKLEGRVLFLPTTLPGARPQVLRIDAATTEAALETLDPKTELAIVVARDAAPDNVTRLVEKLRDKGFERLTVRVEE